MKFKDMKFELKDSHLLLIGLTIVFLIFWSFSSSVINQYDSTKTGRVIAVKSTSKSTHSYSNYEVVVEFEENRSIVVLNSRTSSADVLFEIYEVAKDNLEKKFKL